MTLRMELTTDWSYERISAYGPQITSAFQKLYRRFPRDVVSVKAIFDEVLDGRLMLWIIFDDEKFAAALLTRVERNERTGRKVLVAVDLAGEGGLEIATLVSDLEDYAASHDLDDVVLLGRIGWRKALAKQGYEIATVNYRKPVTVAQFAEAAE